MRALRNSALVALVLALAALVRPGFRDYLHERAWNVPADQRALAVRALSDGAYAFNTKPEALRRWTRPRLRRLADGACVALRSSRDDAGGGYFVCYDRDGRIRSERAIFPALGPTRISDSLWEPVW